MTYAEAIHYIPQGQYKNQKNQICNVICIAKHTKDREPLVIYQEQWGAYDVEARPADEWYKKYTKA